MALIEKIRRQGWLVLTMVGIGIVGFLIPYDAVIALFGGTNSDIGRIGGNTITQQEWKVALDARRPLFRYEGNEQSLFADTWNQMIETELYNDEFNELGLTITDEEYDEITFGTYLSPFVKSTIYQGKDSTELKENMRKNFAGDIPNSLTPQQSEGWKKLIMQKRQKEKYDAMIKRGVYANNIDAKWAFKLQNDKAAVDYVVKSYAEIPDSTITWSESDLRAWYNKHKKDREYKQETSRSIDYITFPVQSSSVDSSEIRDALKALIPQFIAATNDSAFAASNASTPMQAISKLKSGALPEPYNSQLNNDSIGKVIGPFVDGGVMKIVKILKRSTEVDSVQARHILVDLKDAAGKAKADSIKNVIAKNNNFVEMAAMYGTDGTKTSGGDLGMFSRGAMVKPFEDAAFNGVVGQLQVVKTDFGYHVLEVTKKNAPAQITKVAVVDKMVVASQRTVKAAYSLAKEFSMNYGDTTAFRLAADTLMGGTRILNAKNIRPSDTNVNGIQNSGEIVNWAYSAELGEISQPMTVDGQYIIAALKDVKERGVPTLANIYDIAKAEVIKEKKAEKFIAMMKEGTLEEIATKLETQVKKGENITMRSANIPGSGVNAPENELIGAIFGLKTGLISTPIIGKGGVYVFTRTADVVPGTSADNYVSDQERLNSSVQGRFIGAISNAYREHADIEDNRYGR